MAEAVSNRLLAMNVPLGEIRQNPATGPAESTRNRASHTISLEGHSRLVEHVGCDHDCGGVHHFTFCHYLVVVVGRDQRLSHFR